MSTYNPLTRHRPSAQDQYFSPMSTMFLRLVPIVLVTLATGAGLTDASYAPTTMFEVPESAYHQYAHLAVELARFKSQFRRPALYLLGLRRVYWPRGKNNIVVVTIDVADSTCNRWPRKPRNHCKPQVSSPIYSCKGRVLVKNGVEFIRFLWTKCWKSICRKHDHVGYSF
ncbi:uncharacterized protein LOC119458810 [Dermacentor silvarum]|uniref:uncharacterized protein LOC119458810 n=1 Tax=Dermacentor silvarum TaxID=543639 RepID=UPI0021019C80|nr:uncharacterized protein LOC119458810 [Dermacentor silvarum]